MNVNGTIKPVLHLAGTADIGDFNEDGTMEVANWIHDTGPLETIQLYAWNASKQDYEKANSDDFPGYFRGAPYNYDRGMDEGKGASSTPQNMLDYAWASTYLNMGDYGKAVSFASIGMKFPSDYYPGKQVWSSIEKTASASQEVQEAYFHLSVQLRRAVDGIVKKYSNFYNPVPHSIPLVSKGSGGIVHVRVIGTFDSTEAGHYIRATELSFAVDGRGLVAGSLVAKDAFGNTVWKG
ncbi:hypothetical protein [Alicyclobacillus dauci]|uniref:Uncharacterized protein n=1 Tax=Alicyclobacillus dauci TaxID=1475485 RepID=A0ABY6Z0S4_9BACL|nr:hypothetical protein [Alicyclobacillus dauci]WAH36322.1 hypothetical protein NZD86_19145 [Alicyclobacillus dauci]